MPPGSVKLKASSWIPPLYIFMEAQLSLPLSLNQPHTYVHRGTNVLQKIFKGHFQDFAGTYEEEYAPTYGRFRLERITEVVENFILCGDYTQAEGHRCPQGSVSSSPQVGAPRRRLRARRVQAPSGP